MGSEEWIECYCEKCGSDTSLFPREFATHTCYHCRSIGFFKPVPPKYLDSVGVCLRNKEEFYEKVVKPSPNFDQSCWDRRLKKIAWLEEERMKEYLSKRANQANVPKCPTCSSTNLTRISGVSKAADTFLFGIFGTKRDKTFHCNNCGYEW